MQNDMNSNQQKTRHSPCHLFYFNQFCEEIILKSLGYSASWQLVFSPGSMPASTGLGGVTNQNISRPIQVQVHLEPVFNPCYNWPFLVFIGGINKSMHAVWASVQTSFCNARLSKHGGLMTLCPGTLVCCGPSQYWVKISFTHTWTTVQSSSWRRTVSPHVCQLFGTTWLWVSVVFLCDVNQHQASGHWSFLSKLSASGTWKPRLSDQHFNSLFSGQLFSSGLCLADSSPPSHFGKTCKFSPLTFSPLRAIPP